MLSIQRYAKPLSELGAMVLLTRITDDNVTFAGTVANGNMRDNYMVSSGGHAYSRS